MSPELSGALAQVYSAEILHQGSIETARTRFDALKDGSSAFASEAMDRLTELEALERRVGADRMHHRDVIGSVHLKFLRAALRNA